MTEKHDHDRTHPGPRLVKLRCQRTGAWLAEIDHARCPYCFGKEVIGRGPYGSFCDYRPGRDPVDFGFPSTLDRHRSG